MLTTKNADRSKLPPMKLQYAEIKDKYPNDIVLFRVGDFFESYFEDAVPVSTICGLRLTGQRVGSKNDKSEKEEKQSNLYPDKEEKLTTEEVMNSKTIIPFAFPQISSFNPNKADAIIFESTSFTPNFTLYLWFFKSQFTLQEEIPFANPNLFERKFRTEFSSNVRVANKSSIVSSL